MRSAVIVTSAGELLSSDADVIYFVGVLFSLNKLTVDACKLVLFIIQRWCIEVISHNITAEQSFRLTLQHYTQKHALNSNH